MFMYYYTVCYFTCIFYAVVRQISMLFIGNKDSVFCTAMTLNDVKIHNEMINWYSSKVCTVIMQSFDIYCNFGVQEI